MNSSANISSTSASVQSATTALVLKLSKVTKTYHTAGHSLTVLNDVSFEVGAGQTCAIVGPSGSGKTTLLGLSVGLDDPDTGAVHLAGQELGEMNEDQRAALRRDEVGFVFQNFQLMPTLTALENVMIPLELRGDRSGAKAAAELLGKVGLGDRTRHYPSQLSGGEQQRVALARAFIHEPAILFADEPTGNLDRETSEPIVEMLFDLNKHHGTALVLVTHDDELASRAQRTIRMRAGRVVEEIVNA